MTLKDEMKKKPDPKENKDRFTDTGFKVVTEEDVRKSQAKIKVEQAQAKKK